MRVEMLRSLPGPVGGVGVGVTDGVGVALGLGVGLGVPMGVAVGVALGVTVGDGVSVGVEVGVGDGVGVEALSEIVLLPPIVMPAPSKLAVPENVRCPVVPAGGVAR
jgi:hypothetical protein